MPFNEQNSVEHFIIHNLTGVNLNAVRGNIASEDAVEYDTVKWKYVQADLLPRDIAEVLGRGLKIPVVSLSPEEAMAHFGWLGGLAGLDLPASSALTQKWLDWHPTGPGMIADLEEMKFL